MPITIPNPPGSPAGSGYSDFETETMRQVTRGFINRRPESIVLTPRLKTRTSSGGYVWTDQTPRTPQIMTMIESGAVPLPAVTLDGVERRVEFELLGEWDAQIARRDTFLHQGREWEVVEIFYDNGYETRALVAGRG